MARSLFFDGLHGSGVGQALNSIVSLSHVVPALGDGDAGCASRHQTGQDGIRKKLGLNLGT